MRWYFTDESPDFCLRFSEGDDYNPHVVRVYRKSVKVYRVLRSYGIYSKSLKLINKYQYGDALKQGEDYET